MTTANKYNMFENRLQKVFRHLSRQARRMGITCYRLYDRDIPEFPMIIELYGDKLYIAEYKSDHGLNDIEYEEWLKASCEIAGKVLHVDLNEIFLRRRQRKEGRQGQYQKLALKKTSFEVEENGLKFLINLSDYLDSGLFLDHRITRQMVRSEAKGKSILNLFCYTGAFSVYAAAGGASEIVSVDLSNTYLDWARQNMKLNRLERDQYDFIKADVLQYLPKFPDCQFDLVILDPPTFSNSKMMKGILDIQRDHAGLINLVLSKTKQGGKLYFSTNYRKFQLHSNEIKGSKIQEITKSTTPFDFAGKLQRACFLITR
jgi:23S rRNA (cytosine1962-C5)-methyltransferase